MWALRLCGRYWPDSRHAQPSRTQPTPHAQPTESATFFLLVPPTEGRLKSESASVVRAAAGMARSPLRGVTRVLPMSGRHQGSAALARSSLGSSQA